MLSRRKLAIKSEIKLYTCLGEAMAMIQFLEDCLSHSIIIKMNPRNISRTHADEILSVHRKYTLGKGIKIGRDEKLFSDEIQSNLDDFLPQRNWLVHKSIAQNEIDSEAAGARVIEVTKRIKAIGDRAQEILRVLEEDLIDHCSSRGADMSGVRAAIRQHFGEIRSCQ